MTDKREDGGAAFPHKTFSGQFVSDGHGAAKALEGNPHPGMSLRDYFAGQALAGIGTWMPPTANGDLSTSDAMNARALWAYEQADAMLSQRKT